MRTLNLRLTAILLVVGVVFGGGVYFLHAYQVRRNAYVFEREADRALDLAAKAAKDKDPQAEKKAYQDAIKNLAWYVRLVPDNVDVLEKLGMLMADHIQDARAFARAFGFLERVLRQEPGRMNVRRRLVGLAIMARRYQDAKEHLQEFLLKDSPKDAELWELLGRCNVGMGEYDLAVENFKKAIEISPTQVEVYLQLAMVLRTHFSRAKEADQWMTKLVQTNPKSFRAHLLRGNYLKNINADDDALREAQKSLELAPDNRDALWLTAQCYFAKGEYEKSRDCATRGIKLYPRTIDMYTALADIELRSGNRDAAIAALQQGLKATEQSPQLLWSMANLLMDVNKLKEAEPIIEELRATEYPKQFVEYLNARREFIQGHWLAARQGFEKVRGLLTTWPGLLKQVDVWIGQCYGQVGNRDLQIESYRRALKMDPFYIPAKVGLTEALLAAGNVDDAIKEYRELGKLGRLTTAGLIPMARMFILQNLRQASSDRNWAPAEQVLEQAEKANPDAVQIPILRAEILVAQNRQADAEALLRKALEKAPKQIELWTGLVSLAARQKDWTKAEQLLEELRKAAGDVVEYRLTQAQYLVRRDGQKAADDVRKLAEDIGRFSDAQRLQLWGGLLDIAIRVNDTQLAKRLCQQIAEKEPNNPQIRYLLFEQALQARDDAGMEQALKEIEQVAGQGAYWLYGQAVRLTLQAKDQKGPSPMLDQALKYLAQARELRQSWSRIPLLMAGIYDQEGKADLALKNYLEAIEMGEHNPGAIRRTVQLLFQKQRYAEASQLLRQLEKQQMLFSPALNRASAEVALRQGEFDRALEMARKAAAESKNYQEYIWLGQVLSIIGRRAQAEKRTKEAEPLLADAEKAFRRAVELDPKVPATWVALIQFLSASEEEDQAQKMIDEAGKNIPAKQAPLALAQCYEAMKKTAAAEEKYEAALAAAPQDPLVVCSVADFYNRTGKPVPAEALLRRIIDGKVQAQNADVIWARRQLALILVARGGYPNIQKARDLIEENLTAAAGSVLDRRVKAGLDTSDPQRSRRKDAINTLETMLREQSATPEDRFQLAQMYLAAGSWVKASGQFRNLVASYGNEPRYLVAYTVALLQHGETSNAEAYIDRLENLQPNHIATVGLRAEILAAKNEPEKALELLNGFIDKPDARPQERNVRVRLVAEKLEQLAQRLAKPAQKPMAERFARQAETLYRAYVEKNSGQEWVLVAFLGRRQRIDEALDLLERTWDDDNPTVLSQVCLIILHSSKIDKEQIQRLGRLLQAALKQFDRAVPLLTIMADLSTKQGRYADAESIYREILQKNSGHAIAMNNLAVLLALQGIKLDESLKLINAAVEIAGPVAAMLDSRASVYMALGEPEQALDDLTSALAEAETPVRFFHQAQAYELAGQQNAAVTAMEKAVQKGLTKEMLQPLEFPTFEKLLQLVRQADSSSPARGKPVEPSAASR